MLSCLQGDEPRKILLYFILNEMMVMIKRLLSYSTTKLKLMIKFGLGKFEICGFRGGTLWFSWTTVSQTKTVKVQIN